MSDSLHETEEERRKREEEQRARGGASDRSGPPTLDEEIVRRWDPARLAKLVARGAGRGESLDLATRSEMARVLPGQDFSSVRVFRGPLAEEVTQRHRADAVTVGNTGMILVRESSRSAPGTASGRALLAHELTHVAQARQGMVFAREGGPDPGGGEHEREAEAVEAKVQAGSDDRQELTLEQEHWRRRKVLERVIELLHEDQRIGEERNGVPWAALVGGGTGLAGLE